MRLFISLPLPESGREQLASVQHELVAARLPLRLARPEGLHLTLAFLGETPAELVTDVETCMQAAGGSGTPLQLSLRGLGTFPSVSRPRVVWAGLTGDLASLEALHQRLTEALRTAGFPVEERAFRPHVTLGRAKEREPWSAEARVALERLLSKPAAEYAVWRAEEIHLMRSELGRAGARYTTLYTWPLGARPEHG
jgi:RNA 2',3'-cyclic 3'-phosphodiesterase